MPVNEEPTKTKKSGQDVFKVFAALLLFTFVVVLFLSFVQEAGDGKSKNNSA